MGVSSNTNPFPKTQIQPFFTCFWKTPVQTIVYMILAIIENYGSQALDGVGDLGWGIWR